MPEHVIATIPADAVELVTNALAEASVRRQRAATRAAGELDEERIAGKRDVRSGAVQIARALADAARLDDAAKAIRSAQPVELPEGVDVAHLLAEHRAATEELRRLRTGGVGAAAAHPPAAAAPPPPTVIVPEGITNPGIARDELIPGTPRPPSPAGVVVEAPVDRLTQAAALANTGDVLRRLGMTIDVEADTPDDLDELDVDLDPLGPDDDVVELPIPTAQEA